MGTKNKLPHGAAMIVVPQDQRAGKPTWGVTLEDPGGSPPPPKQASLLLQKAPIGDRSYL